MIVVTTQCFPPDLGGIESYVAGLSDALARRGHVVSVFCDAAETSAARAFDVARTYTVSRFGGPRPWRRRRKAEAVKTALRRREGRFVIADSWKSLELLTEESLGRVRVVCLAHGAEFLAEPGSSKAARIVEALRKATFVAANSQFTAGLVEPFVSGTTKLRVVLPGVETLPGTPRTESELRKLRSSRLLTIARLEPQKGIDTVLHALAGMRESHPGLTYDVVGGGSDFGRLRALAESLRVADRVQFHGQVSQADKAALLARADAFVLANRLEPGEVEGFGIVFIEAAAFGLPSIAGCAGGTSDAVTAGKTGLIVDGADRTAVLNALKSLVDDPEMASRMGREGHRRFWSEFAWDAAVARFETALFDPVA